MDLSRARIFLRISRFVAFGSTGGLSFALGPFSINLQTATAPALPVVFLGTFAYSLYREFDTLYYTWSISRALEMAARLDEEEEELGREKEAFGTLDKEYSRLHAALEAELKVLTRGSNISQDNDRVFTRLDVERRAEASRRIDDICKELSSFHENVLEKKKSWVKRREKLLKERKRLHQWLLKLQSSK